MYTTTNMGLTIWNLVTDLFSHTQLEGNFSEIDAHDHTSGNGVQIPTGGIANGAITAAKIGFPAVSYSSGTLAALPAVSSATAGEYYYATDTAALMFCVGGAWIWVNGGRAPTTYRHVSSSATAKSGDWAIVDAGRTLTLPAPTTADAVITVVANSGASGSSPITVAASTGSIYGGGLTAASSFTLGTPGTAATLQADGAGTWWMVSGQRDTGWVPLTVAANGLPAGNGGLYARLVGDQVQMGGFWTNTSGSAVTSYGTLPGAMWTLDNGRNVPIVLTGVGGVSGETAVALAISGQGDLAGPSWPNNTNLYFDSVAYTIQALPEVS